MALQQGNPFFYRLYPGRYGIARAGFGSSPLWKIETKDSTFVQVGTKREREEGEFYGSRLENSSRSARRKGKRNARDG